MLHASPPPGPRLAGTRRWPTTAWSPSKFAARSAATKRTSSVRSTCSPGGCRARIARGSTRPSNVWPASRKSRTRRSSPPSKPHAVRGQSKSSRRHERLKRHPMATRRARCCVAGNRRRRTLAGVVATRPFPTAGATGCDPANSRVVLQHALVAGRRPGRRRASRPGRLSHPGDRTQLPGMTSSACARCSRPNAAGRLSRPPSRPPAARSLDRIAARLRPGPRLRRTAAPVAAADRRRGPRAHLLAGVAVVDQRAEGRRLRREGGHPRPAAAGQGAAGAGRLLPDAPRERLTQGPAAADSLSLPGSSPSMAAPNAR